MQCDRHTRIPRSTAPRARVFGSNLAVAVDNKAADSSKWSNWAHNWAYNAELGSVLGWAILGNELGEPLGSLLVSVLGTPLGSNDSCGRQHTRQRDGRSAGILVRDGYRPWEGRLLGVELGEELDPEIGFVPGVVEGITPGKDAGHFWVLCCTLYWEIQLNGRREPQVH